MTTACSTLGFSELPSLTYSHTAYLQFSPNTSRIFSSMYAKILFRLVSQQCSARCIFPRIFSELSAYHVFPRGVILLDCSEEGLCKLHRKFGIYTLIYTASYHRRLESSFMTSVTEWNIQLQVNYLQFGCADETTILNTCFSHRPSSFPAAITGNFTGGHLMKICTRSF